MKSKNGSLGIGGIMSLFIMLIVSLVLIVEIFDQQTVLTTKRIVTNESVDISVARDAANNDINESSTGANLTIANPPTTDQWKVDRCPIESFVFGNSSTDFVADTDYIFYPASGIMNLLNTTTTSRNTENATLADYVWCPDGYNPDQASRSMAGLIGLLSAIALLAFAVWKSDILNFD